MKQVFGNQKSSSRQGYGMNSLQNTARTSNLFAQRLPTMLLIQSVAFYIEALVIKDMV